MPSLPIPLVSSLILTFLLVRLWLAGRAKNRTNAPLVALLGLCAAQGLIIVLAQHYQVPIFRYVQPVTASVIPPLAYFAFLTTAVRTRAGKDLIHMAGPILAVLAVLIRPEWLDLLIPVTFTGYGLAILWHAMQGADAMPRMRLAAGDLPGVIWLVMGGALVGSAFSDVLIIAALIGGAPHLHPWIISIYSSLMLLVMGGLTLSQAIEATPPEQPPSSDIVVTEEDTQIVARLDTLMAEQQLYLNPDLTLTQIARRLVLPTKQVSAAINRVTGENVSRYINAARIRAAQQEMLAGQSITNAMLAAGFNTKSNFNREFLRVAGQPPSDWLAAQSTGD